MNESLPTCCQQERFGNIAARIHEEAAPWVQKTPVLAVLPTGFHPLPEDHVCALNYVGEQYFKKSAMSSLPYYVPGPNNDLQDRLHFEVSRAVNKEAVVYVFGTKYRNGKGVHNVHMNQGNPARTHHASDNVFRDGALLFHFQGDADTEERWVGFFFAFKTQSWNA